MRWLFVADLGRGAKALQALTCNNAIVNGVPIASVSGSAASHGPTRSAPTQRAVNTHPRAARFVGSRAKNAPPVMAARRMLSGPAVVG